MDSRLRLVSRKVLPAIAVVALLAIASGLALVCHPYFGNMDDGRFLSLASERGPFGFAGYLAGGPATGFIRFSSMVLLWPIYWIGNSVGPVWYFTVNGLVVFACVAASGIAFWRLLKWSESWIGVAFLGASVLWPYTAEMFFPEK